MQRILEPSGGEPHQYLRSVQGRDGDQVKGSEYDVDGEHLLENDVQGARGLQETIEYLGDEGEENIGGYAGCRNEDESHPGGFQVAEIDRDGICPAETEEEEHERAQRVEVAPGVEGEPSQPPCGGIAHLVCYPSMGHLMDDNRIEQRNRNKDERNRVMK